MIILSIYDPNVLQVEAFRLVAEGKLKEALSALDTAVAESEGKNPGLLTIDPATAASLQRFKTVFMLESGMSAARNNRGVIRFLTGDLKGAQEDLDYAAVASPETPVPWINAALVLLDQRRPQQAEKSAQGALLRGTDNARARAVTAEVSLALGRVSLAREDAERAVKLAGTDPYGLYVLAQALRASGRANEADRMLVQALSLEPRTAVGAPLAPITGAVSGLGGNASEQHSGFHAVGPTFRVRGQRIQQQVEGRDNALQADEYIEATFGAPKGQWAGYAVAHRSAGGRPGSLFGGVGSAAQPDALFRLDQQKVSLVRQDRYTAFHVGYSHDAVVSKLSGSTATTWPIQDQRMIAEGRLLTKSWNAGVSWSQNWRKTQGTGLNFNTQSPVEPAEQILPSGRWAQSVGWAFFSRTLSDRLTVSAGPVALLTRRTTVVQPYLDLAIKGISETPSHFRIRPRVAQAGGDFFPEAARGDVPQDNTIDRHEDSGQTLNRSPLLTGPEGRIVESSFSVPKKLGKAELDTKLFHSRMTGVFTQSADPRVASGLVLTPISHAEATGLQQSVRWRINRNLIGRVGVRYQEAYGRVVGATHGATQTSPSTPRGLSNFPRWQGSGRLDTSFGTWSVGSEVQVVGQRPVWQTIGSGRSTATSLGQAKETVGLNLYLKHQVSSLGEFSLSLFNLTSASFYPGYPGSVTGISGFAWRF